MQEYTTKDMILLFALMTVGFVSLFAIMIFVDNVVRGRRAAKKTDPKEKTEKAREKIEKEMEKKHN